MYLHMQRFSDGAIRAVYLDLDAPDGSDEYVIISGQRLYMHCWPAP